MGHDTPIGPSTGGNSENISPIEATIKNIFHSSSM